MNPRFRVEILHVPGCTLLEPVRSLVKRAAKDREIDASIEDIEGDYPSPTVLVNGVDVTGRSLGPGAACRLDPPTYGQLRAAFVVGMPVADPT